MKARLDYRKDAIGVYNAMSGLEKYLEGCGLEKPLLDLVRFRASQINGCAYCMDMHSKELRAEGETEQRLYTLNAWRDCPYYTDRERAALTLTEAVTEITKGHVPDEVYESVQPFFTGKEIADLTLAIASINAWNRLAITARVEPGTFRLPARSANAASEQRRAI